MPIKVNLAVVLAQRGVKSKELAQAIGITEANLSLLKQGKVTQFFGVPAIYQAFSLLPAVGEINWGAIRCGCGGAPALRCAAACAAAGGRAACPPRRSPATRPPL